jgi:casein kinase II subunit beta
MEEEQLQVYNSDSNEEQVDLDQLSIDMNGPHASGWI